jgi:hypothetical protein
MAIIKCGLLVNYSAPGENEYSAGWEEQVYMEGAPNDPALQANFKLLAQARAGILNSRSHIVGQRYDQVEPQGPSDSDFIRYPGVLTTAADVIQLCIDQQYQTLDGLNNRPFQFRGLCDSMVVGNFFVPSTTFNINKAIFDTALNSGLFLMRGINKANPQRQIVSITTGGLLTTVDNHGFVVGDRVQILRGKSASGGLLSGVFFVDDVPTLKTAHLVQWPVESSDRGQARKYEIIYPAIKRALGQVDGSRISTRKTGRPFFQSRGRVSARR